MGTSFSFTETLKHIKLGKPDTQEHYPSKGEGTPATAQSKERVNGPPHPRPKQDDRQQNLLVPTHQNVQWEKVCAAWYENPKNHTEKIGNVSRNQCSHTKPLGVKGKERYHIKNEKSQRARAEMNTCIIIIHP